MHAHIATGMSVARSVLPLEMALVGVAPDNLIAFISRAHLLTFGDVHPWAGRFRAHGERVYVGHNDHEFEGAAAHEIEACLTELWGGLCRPVPVAGHEDSEERFALWAAVFLEQFLTIHPFVDGNGRVGRFVVEAAAMHAGFLYAEPYGSMDSKAARKDRQQYLYALQYAHKYCGVSSAAYLLGVSSRSNPHRFLARWWRKRLIDIALYELDDDRPSWIDEEWLLEDGEPPPEFFEDEFLDDDG